MPLKFKDKRLKTPSSKTQKSGVAGKTSLSSCPDLQHEPALGAWWRGLQGRTSTLVQVRTSSGLVHLRQLRDWSLITGRGGGGYKMGKSRVWNFLHLNPLKTG